MSLRATVKIYYRLTKPGIIYGNLLPTVAGFMLASNRHISFRLFLSVIIGQSLVIACGCVLNNILDRNIDSKMTRTKSRALVTGVVRPKVAVVYSVILGALGSLILGFYTNALTLAIGLFGLFAYVVMYGAAKRAGTYGTIVGSISGALPPVAGYAAVSGHLNEATLLLFLILVCWQMPHFYAISMYRLNDYAAAGIPVLSVKRGLQRTKRSMVAWTVGFNVSTLLLSILGYTGWSYLLIASIFSGWWLGVGIAGFKRIDNDAWARKMFLTSLVVLTVVCVTITLNPWLG